MENITPLVLQKGKEVRGREPRQKRRTPITQKDILAYKKDIDALGLTQRAVCEYCGNENIADKDVWICFYCESVNYSAILALRSQDAELMNIVTRMNGFVSEGNYGEAINEHKKLFDKYNDP
ncbi:MAG: hypothetical protein M1504_03085, partial [Candidatus Marsarchaeota archaeon]|nr:hypothetical protein [Candidatus Marsarchaeota archaeon]